jgi:hypothetical protein
VGLLGDTTISARVRSVMAAATSATCGTKPSSTRVATGTIVAPAIVAARVYTP